MATATRARAGLRCRMLCLTLLWVLPQPALAQVLERPATGTAPVVTVIDDFETGVNDWWPPAHTGNLAGVLRDAEGRPAAWRDHDRSLENPRSGRTGALRLSFQWDPAIRFTEPAPGGAASHLVRLHLPPEKANTPSRRFGPGQALEVLVHGDGSGNRFRIVVRDGNAELEGSPWITVHWTGWRRIIWDLDRGPVIGWVNGDGVLDGQHFHFDSILVTRDEAGTARQGTLYFDDLRVIAASGVAAQAETPAPVRGGDGAEPAREISERQALQGVPQPGAALEPRDAPWPDEVREPRDATDHADTPVLPPRWRRGRVESGRPRRHDGCRHGHGVCRGRRAATAAPEASATMHTTAAG
ncbi:hypothetical protein [Thioalkalivibrio paradoxus]|uniref:Uncharacterized protein n=1 Tax=Thioalkalivibrio paradoxus ARh 1 TaxID=713585 RepID=W0DP82_9GAMM|nr:hypothetical protein [Thioalkalivibrio paradoxus]AHF00262.1 hypothetical protein THITH_14695 [Thioalkalivibrio paradoxus ARh 1]